ncbi:MAG: metallophosphoesterase [Aeromicrobium sp.]|uniref:metallophosphoesterase n=1 Tax=Aeromicrobium sp. TaxID=1871063 RepID=UPI0039E2E28E
MSEPRAVLDADVLALAGDWHGATTKAVVAIERLARLSEERSWGLRWICHLGDFGLWPGNVGARYLNVIDEALERHGLGLLVTPGNHEWWAFLREAFAASDYAEPVMVRPRIAFLPPGYRFDVTTSSGATRSVLSVGGAPSIDLDLRVEGADWWPGEAITDEDVDRAVTGGSVDVLLAHDAPDDSTAAVRHIIARPSGWSRKGLTYAAAGRAQLNRVCAEVRPKFYAHGHYHVHDVEQRGQTLYVSLDCEGRPGNLMLLDVEALTVAPVPRHEGK